MGFATGYTPKGLIGAQVTGTPYCVSERKKRKRWNGMTVTIYDPPCRPSAPPHHRHPNPATIGFRCTRKRFGELNAKVKTAVLALRWEPQNARDAVTRLGDLAR